MNGVDTICRSVDLWAQYVRQHTFRNYKHVLES